MSIDIEVRSGVKFHSGREMTAEDVKFSLEYLPETVSQVAFIAEQFDHIDVTSDTSLTITFTQPIPNLFDLFEYAFILDKDTVDGLQDGSEIIGTGPFTFADWKPGSEYTLEKNSDYWGEEPHLDTIDVLVISDSTAMLNAVRSGRAQLAIGMSTQDVQSLAQDAKYTVDQVSPSVYPLGVNIEEEPFDNAEVRRAVQIAIDRERIADQVFGDAATPSALFWDPNTTPGYPSDLEDAFAYDPDEAKKIISDEGASGAKVTLTVISIPNNRSVAEIVRNNLEEAGLDPEIEIMEGEEFGATQVAGELGQAFMPLHGLNGFSPYTLLSTLPSLREGNSSKFWTDEYAQLQKDLGQATTEEESETALRDLSQYMIDEAFTANIVRVEGQNVSSADVQGLEWSTRGYLDAASAFISE
jgi:peptide/nickel transport system substrate-binding protein